MTTTQHLARRERVAAAMRAAMGDRNVNRADLARLMKGEPAKSTVYRYWAGERDISIPDLEAMCVAAGIDVLAVMRAAMARRAP